MSETKKMAQDGSGREVERVINYEGDLLMERTMEFAIASDRVLKELVGAKFPDDKEKGVSFDTVKGVVTSKATGSEVGDIKTDKVLQFAIILRDIGFRSAQTLFVWRRPELQDRYFGINHSERVIEVFANKCSCHPEGEQAEAPSNG